MPDRPPFDYPYPFYEQPTDDSVTGSAAQCSDPLQVDSRQHPSLEYHWLCQKSNIAHFSHAFVPLARLLSAARGALFQRLLGRGRVIPISIKPSEL